jgi:hypothetical protein
LLIMKIKQIARQLVGTDAAEIAEVALVLPLVFMLLLGIVWFGRAFNIYSTIQQAAQQGAITAARSSCGTCASPNTVTTPGVVQGVVLAVMNSSNLQAGQIQEAPNPGLLPCPSPAPPGSCTLTASNIWVCSSVLLNSTTQPAQCGTMVSFQYPFQFNFPGTSLNLQQIILSAQAQSRMEN